MRDSFVMSTDYGKFACLFHTHSSLCNQYIFYVERIEEQFQSCNKVIMSKLEILNE